MGDKWELIGKIKSSEWRLKVLRILNENMRTPSELARESNISVSHISGVIRELEKMNLVECKNPALRKGKIYAITRLGKEIVEKIHL